MIHTAYDERWPVVESRYQIHYPSSLFLNPPPPSPPPLSRITELIFENNPSQWRYPKNDHCKLCVHVRDLAERLASLCAVVGCLILDVHLLIVFQVPITLLCMVDCYTAHCTLIEIIQKIVRKVLINWKTFVRQMQISCISLLTVRVMLASWKSPADIRTCLSKQVPVTKLDYHTGNVTNIHVAFS